MAVGAIKFLTRLIGVAGEQCYILGTCVLAFLYTKLCS